MAIHNRSHRNHALMSLNRKQREIPPKPGAAAASPKESVICLEIADCCDFLKGIPDGSVQLICIDPPYNLDLASWDSCDHYIDWAAKWIAEAYRVLSDTGSMAVFGGIQFRDAKSGDLIDIIRLVRRKAKFKLVNAIIWQHRNGIPAQSVLWIRLLSANN